VIPALWRPRQEDQYFKGSFSYILRPVSKKEKNVKRQGVAWETALAKHINSKVLFPAYLQKSLRKTQSRVTQVVEHKPSKGKALRSNSSTTNKKEGKEGGKGGERKEGRKEGRDCHKKIPWKRWLKWQTLNAHSSEVWEV
jgi:hypothetical protein